MLNFLILVIPVALYYNHFLSHFVIIGAVCNYMLAKLSHRFFRDALAAVVFKESQDKTLIMDFNCNSSWLDNIW